MRVVNCTGYRTDDRAKFLRAGLKAMGAEWQSYRIDVFAEGRRKISRAGLGYHRVWMVLREQFLMADGAWWAPSGSASAYADKPRRVDVERFARVFEHEVGHTLGLKHAEMSDHREGPPPAWCAGLEIRPKEPKAKPTPADRAAAREAHVRAMLAKAERRLKIAKATVRRWRAKAKHYDRRRAAESRGPGAP